MENLDIKHDEIKRRMEDCYDIIKVAEKEIKKIREKECDHPLEKKVDYQWAPGHINPNVTICSVCGEII